MSSVKVPRAFISYSWDDEDHKQWVLNLATRLRHDSVDVMLDQWGIAPGDQLTEFMEHSLRERDFILIICTPQYKRKSDQRIGGVGYEGHIMTAELFTACNDRKFIPILRRAKWEEAAPSWLRGKYYINLSEGDGFEASYQDLLATLHGQRLQAPPIGVPPKMNSPLRQGVTTSGFPSEQTDPTVPIKITGIITKDITKPRMDGTRGSGLYAIPFQLSRRPSSEWVELFVETWNHPPQWTNMHRSGIARVSGDRVILDGTTIEEVERYHRETLLAVLDRVNQLIAEHEERKRREAEITLKHRQHHEAAINDAAKRIKFD